jgi:hypothetical protein
MATSLFGFEILRKKDAVQNLPSPIAQEPDDGSVVVNGGGVYGTYVDLDGSVRSEAELVNKYRQMAEHPEVETAIDDIVNEAIIVEPQQDIVKIILDKTGLSNNVKNVIEREFVEALRLLDFSTHAYEIFKRWYVDGRMYFFCVVDPENTRAGVQELRYVDPRKIRKVRETKKKRDRETQYTLSTPPVEYYLFNDKGFYSTSYGSQASGTSQSSTGGIRIAKDSIINVTSGITSSKGDMILSYLHKAIKPLNQLRTMEDSLVIYRVSRSPERRVFYIDVGNLPKMKAEQYLRDIMIRFKNKIVYDSSTGEIRDDRKFMTMLEDFWLPRREGGRGTEIDTLPGGQNLGQIEDIVYFQKQLFGSLNVPVTRLDPDRSFSFGNNNEITRDEVKFSKFINRLRTKFSTVFTKILERQVVLKGLMTVEDFDAIAGLIAYDFVSDNHYAELKEGEIRLQRFNQLAVIDPYVGRYVSNEWVRTNVLYQAEEEQEQIDKEIAAEDGNPQYKTKDEKMLEAQTNATMAQNLHSASLDPEAKGPIKKAAAKSFSVQGPISKAPSATVGNPGGAGVNPPTTAGTPGNPT